MAGKDKNIWDYLLKDVPVPVNPMIGGDPRYEKGIPAFVHIGGRRIATVLTRDALKKNLKNTSPVPVEIANAIRTGTLKVPNLTAKQLTNMVAEASRRTTKLPASKPSPLKLPGSFGKGGWSAGPPKSNVVPLRTSVKKPPRTPVEKPFQTSTEKVISPKDKLDRFMRNIDSPERSADKEAYKALKKTQVGKSGNVIDFKPKTKKARGGKLNKGYARGGGIRKPKW